MIMTRNSNDDTICAIATPPGHGGVGIVRMSGPAAKSILESIWCGTVSVAQFEQRKLYLGDIKIGCGMMDKVMAVFMPSPHTYTGQDVVELSCHGSPLMLDKIVKSCIDGGARLAGPGEFTRRAFLAGKIDLVQAEAVADLINAKSEAAAKTAAEELSGRLSSKLTELSDGVLNLRTYVEASLDFPEEDIEFLRDDDFLSRMRSISKKLSGLIATYEEGHIIRDGITAVIMGKPNTGKSSILNRLIGKDRAIVHHTPGTTRDVIDAEVNIGGIVFHLKDTAGLRSLAGEVEEIGMGRAHEEGEAADLVLFVVDRSDEGGLCDLIHEFDAKRTILIGNKCDLPRACDVERLSDERGMKCVKVSAKTGENLSALREVLEGFAKRNFIAGDGVVITKRRHKDALVAAKISIDQAMDLILSGQFLEIIAEKLREAHDSIGEITGQVKDEDLLDRIFSSFCIGK
jgi:tRNA modification GTPase